MFRPSLRRTPKLESLETRQVLSSIAGPSADKQYVLEMINLVRTNPSAAADRFTNNLSNDVQATLKQYGLTADGLRSELKAATPLPPLAYSDALDGTAQGQSQDEAAMGKQTHTGANGSSLGDRLKAANYNLATAGENTYAYANNVDQAMQSFLFDWGVADHGHYNNLVQPGVSAQKAYKDIGIGLVNTQGNGVGPLVITTDFGAEQNEGPQIVGVVYNDKNHDNFYTPGEGEGNVTITATDSTGKAYSVQTWQSGGYQIPVPTGQDYTVTASVNGQILSSQSVHVSDVNTKVDFVVDASQVTAPARVAVAATLPPAPVAAPRPIPAPTPVATPTPAPTPIVTPPPVIVAIPTITSVTPATTPSWLNGWSKWKAIESING